MLLATPAAANITAAVDGDDAVVCYDTCDETACFVVTPKTGAVVRRHSELLPNSAAVGQPEVLRADAFKRCGAKCAALRKRLVERDELVAAIDPTGKLLFEIDLTYPTEGHTWSLKTGKRISRFVLDEFDGPPPPVSFDHVEFVGRHVFVGTPGDDFMLTFDVFTGARGLLFQQQHVGRGLVIENAGSGRIDLVDYAQPGHPIVAFRRVKSRKDHTTMTMKVIALGDQAVVALDEPHATLLVDLRKRKISKPRPIACP